MPKKPQIVPGTMFGRLTYLGEAEPMSGRRRAMTACHCGATFECHTNRLKAQQVKDCGCSRNWDHANVTHGMTRASGTEPEYLVWRAMRDRCENPKNKSYRTYGARGIAVCDEWKSFERFIADMGRRPSAAYSIDRIDNSGPYAADNCRWATRAEQACNRSDNKMVRVGEVTKPLPAWAHEYGIAPSVLRRRIKRGWDIEAALTTATRRERAHISTARG
jgi:hypothetical protein